MANTETSQEIPIDGMAEKLDRIKRFGGPPAEFRSALPVLEPVCCSSMVRMQVPGKI